MRWLALPRTDWRLVVGGAVMTVIAYPPFHLFVPSFICLIPAVWLIEDGHADARPWRRQIVQGFWYGLISHGLILYWIVSALWHFTKLSILGYAAMIGLYALYFGLCFAVTGWIVRRTRLPLLLVLPVMWTATDWWIGHEGDMRFAWLGLGTSLTGFPTVVQIADTIGARGIMFLLVAANVALAMAWARRATRGAWWCIGGVAVGLGLALTYGTVRERTLAVESVGNVAVIQPNVAPSQDRDGRSRDEIFSHLMQLSRDVLESSEVDLLVWPEAAIPGYFQDRSAWRPALAGLSNASGTPMLVGGLDLDYRSRDDYDAYNAVFFFEPGQDSVAVYRKRYLVPVTERVPFVNPEWFRGMAFLGGFGIGQHGTVFPFAEHGFGVLICYESIFENLARQLRRDGAAFLLNVTNDAWFGRTSAPYQHMSHLVMRAIENRVGIARAANSGISGWIDPTGRIHEPSGLYEEQTGIYPLTTGSKAPLYVTLGDWVGVLSVVAALGLIVVARRRQVSIGARTT